MTPLQEQIEHLRYGRETKFRNLDEAEDFKLDALDLIEDLTSILTNLSKNLTKTLGEIKETELVNKLIAIRTTSRFSRIREAQRKNIRIYSHDNDEIPF